MSMSLSLVRRGQQCQMCRPVRPARLVAAGPGERRQCQASRPGIRALAARHQNFGGTDTTASHARTAIMHHETFVLCTSASAKLEASAGSSAGMIHKIRPAQTKYQTLWHTRHWQDTRWQSSAPLT